MPRISAVVSISGLTGKQKGRRSSTSFLVEWDLRQDGRLDHVFGLFVRVHQLATRIYQSRCYENDEVPFDIPENDLSIPV